MLKSATAKMGAPNKRLAALKALQMGLLPVDGSDLLPPDTVLRSRQGIPDAQFDVGGWPVVRLAAAEVLSLSFQQMFVWRVYATPQPGQTGPNGECVWGADSSCGQVGLRWSWVQIEGEVIVMDNPLEVFSNIILLQPGQSKTPQHQQLVLLLATIVNRLPWQVAVQQFLVRSNEVTAEDKADLL